MNSRSFVAVQFVVGSGTPMLTAVSTISSDSSAIVSVEFVLVRFVVLLKHLVNRKTVSFVTDGFVVTLSGRTATGSTSRDFRSEGKNKEEDE